MATRRPPAAVEPVGRGWWATMLAHCGLLVLTLAIGAAAVVGVAYVRISHGPISLKFLARAVERGINAELAGVEARLEDAQVALSPAGGFEVLLTGLKFAETDGDVVASVPKAAIELSRPALWSMKLVPSRIDLIEPRLNLAYSEAAGLTLTFDRPPGERLGDSAAAGRAAPAPATADEGPRASRTVQIKEAAERARAKLGASAYLNQIGVRDAVVTVDNEGVRSEWRVTEGTIDLDRQRRDSLASARATIGSERGPWTVVLTSEAAEGSQGLTLKASVAGLVPRVLGNAIPQLRLFKVIDAPVSGQATLGLTKDGTVAGSKVTLAVGRGQIRLPAVAEVPFDLETGQISMTYDGASQQFTLLPSTLDWGGSHIGIAGGAHPEPSTDIEPAWLYDFKTTDGQFSADDVAAAPVAIERGTLKGRVVPGAGEVRIDELAIKAGGAELTGKGLLVAGTAATEGSARFEAKLGPTPAEVFKTLWPRSLLSPARLWVGQKIKRGTIKSGTLRFVSGGFARDAGVAETAGGLRRLSVTAEAVDLQGTPLKWMPPVEAPRVLVQIENNSIEVTVPDAAIVLAPNRRIPLKGGRFTSSNLDAVITTSEITFHSVSGLVPVLELMDLSPLHILKGNGLTTEGIDGKVDGQIKLFVPLIPDLDPKDVKIEARAKVYDGRAKQFAGVYDIQGAAVDIDVTVAAVDAKGSMLVNGVPVRVGWQHVLDTNGEQQPQPPLRLSATLDNSDRAQLGIDLNHIVQGEVPVEVLIEKGAQDETLVKLRADLGNADIAIESIAWRKPPGRAATLQADVAKGKVHKYDLQNLRIVGDDIAIEGTAGISADNKLREVNLPGVQLNVITRLAVAAVLKGDGGADKTGNWSVKVQGANFDGRDLFRSLFAVGPVSDRAVKPGGKPVAGMDLEADIDNVIGHGEVSLRGAHLKMSRRGEKVVNLEARGTLDGGGPVVITMNTPAGEPRRLLADTTDAGQALKLIGFYPNMQSGRGRLEVNVDGKGPAEKTGTLWVENFRILGDPIVSEVLNGVPGSPDEPQHTLKGQKKAAAQREVFEFNGMQVPFSIGYGQFVIDNGYMRGPLLGVSLGGKADFKLRSLNLGGTYIPLQGLNSALRGVPLLGELTTGPKGEGTFGITFAVQGPMAQPQVLVNPLSLVAPGIFREIFQMTNTNQKVIPREEKAQPVPVEKRVRAGAPGVSEPARAKSGPAAAGPNTGGGGADGWVSQSAPR